MKRFILTLFLLFPFFYLAAQENKNISSGNITIVSNQKMNFKNLQFIDDQVKFFNTETKSEFIYFLNTIRTIQDANGNVLYSNKQEIKEIKQTSLTIISKVKKDWIKEPDSLREKKQVRAEIITINGDTIKTHIKVTTNMFNAKLINELCIIETIKSISNDIIIKYNSKDITSLRFMDFKDVERLFVSNGKQMVELLFDGKIRWFRLFYQDSSGAVSAFDYMINADLKKNANLGLFNSKVKKIKELTVNRPDLIPLIENMKMDDENILILLKKYNE